MNWLKNGNINEPQVALSAQAINNCQGGGTCNGGMPLAVYRFAKTHGLAHTSCTQYTAEDVSKDEVCSDFNVCRDCKGPAPAANETGLENCWAIDYKHYYVSGYRAVIGAKQMKKEIATYGPISCGMQVTPGLQFNYTEGIYEEKLLVPIVNHIVSVVGYGETEDGVPYWIVRNSWGSYWGEYGFFKLRMHKRNLGIELDCVAGYPTYEAPKYNEETE